MQKQNKLIFLSLLGFILLSSFFYFLTKRSENIKIIKVESYRNLNTEHIEKVYIYIEDYIDHKKRIAVISNKKENLVNKLIENKNCFLRTLSSEAPSKIFDTNIFCIKKSKDSDFFIESSDL